jgi:hypothetical protein
VGASVWQTPGGVQSELARINADMATFSAEITAASARHGFAAHDPLLASPIEIVGDAAAFQRLAPKDSIAVFFNAVWSPFAHKWRAFYDENSGWLDNLWWNHGPEAEQFHEQLGQLRDAAQKLGMSVMSPTPVTFSPSVVFDPHRNIFDESHDAAKKAGSDVEKMIKVAVYGGLALVGVVVVATVAQSVRSNESPVTALRRRA